MKYKVWNKLDNINNSTAEEYLGRNSFMVDKDIFLIINEYEEVEEVCVCDFIKRNYNLNANLTVDEVAQRYLEIKNEEKLNKEKEILTLEEQANKISILEEQNKELEDALVELAGIVGGGQ